MKIKNKYIKAIIAILIAFLLLSSIGTIFGKQGFALRMFERSFLLMILIAILLIFGKNE